MLHFVQPKSKEGGPGYCDITCFVALLDWSINWLNVLIVLHKVPLWLGKCVERLQFTNHWHQAQIFPFALYWLAVFWTSVMFHSTINRWYLDRNTTTVQYKIRTVNRNIHHSAGKFASQAALDHNLLIILFVLSGSLCKSDSVLPHSSIGLLSACLSSFHGTPCLKLEVYIQGA